MAVDAAPFRLYPAVGGKRVIDVNDFSKKSLGMIEIEAILFFYFQPFFRKIDNIDNHKTYNKKDPPTMLVWC